MTFRFRVFLAALATTAVAAGISAWLMSAALRTAMRDEIRDGLADQAALGAALLEAEPALPDPAVEAHALGARIHARVTLIAGDGRVLGDSEIAPADLGTLENHATRPEIVAARNAGRGWDVRASHTTGLDTMYAAERVARGPIAFVRVALPLAAVDDRIASIERLSLIGFGAALVVALALSWGVSVVLSARLRAIADVARRRTDGDRTRPPRDFGDDEIGIVGRALDDTIRELGARLDELTRDRAQMQTILSGMFEGVLLVDGAGRILLTNGAARNILRLPDDAAGRQFIEVVRHPGIARALSAALRGEPSGTQEVELDRHPGRSYQANVVRVEHGAPGGAVLVLHDVTELRQADRMRRDFVANVSHELRTPLTAVRGYVEALLDGPPDAPEARRFLEIIARHTHRMERLVRDLLRLARLDAGQETIDRVRCPIETLASGVATDMAAALLAKRQRLEVRLDPDARVVLGDAAKLHDVLRNLVENASNYGPEGTAIELTATRDGERVVIAVADRGPGIPEAEITRIFERFYRVDRSRSRDPGGTGLGLSIVRHLVELHGGQVWAANREGGGTIVRVAIAGE